MDWKEFFKPTKTTIGIPILLFILYLLLVTIMNGDLNDFFSLFAFFFTIKREHYNCVSKSCGPVMLPFTILGLLMIYFITCTIRYFIIKSKK